MVKVPVTRLPVCRNHPERDAPTRGRYAYLCGECRAEARGLTVVEGPEGPGIVRDSVLQDTGPLVSADEGVDAGPLLERVLHVQDGADPGWLDVHAGLVSLHVEKSSTYGHGGERLANFTAVAAVTGEPAERYALVRIIEKATRALNMIDLTGQADDVGEYPDMASLAIICEALRRRRVA